MTNKRKRVGFVCFGEINTPFEKLQEKHDNAIVSLSAIDMDIIDGGVVIDDEDSKTANSALTILHGQDIDCLIVCVAGWIPAHAVLRVTDTYRKMPILLWGLCGWKSNGRIITTAEQAGTTSLRPTFEALDYRFKYVYNMIGQLEPIDKIQAFISAAYSERALRNAKIGTMGYRDMLLYSTTYEASSLRREIGVEVESYEMLEMVQTVETLDKDKIAQGVKFVKENWKFQGECVDETIIKGVKYALAISKKIDQQGWEAVTLVDVDGMKKLLGFPPAMVFMLLEHYNNVLTTPENDVLGNVTQLMMRYLTGQTVPYLEYYEFFPKSVLIGVPDYIPAAATDGDVKVLPAAFGLLSSSLLNVSSLKTGKVTCSRLQYKKGKYYMHSYTGTAKTPPEWNEYGWDEPAPQLPSLEVELESCTVEEFAQVVGSQHVIVTYGDQTEALHDLCKLLGIEWI